MRTVIRTCLLALGLAHGSSVLADDVLVAVAASLVPPMAALADRFGRASSHRVQLASSSTGALYAQAINGAPFDVFVAADAERPQRLVDAGIGIATTRTTIAFGRLALFSNDTESVAENGLDALRDRAIRHIAIANPSVAPYGAAAQQTLEALGLWDPSDTRIVRGESVAQTFAMIATGNAEIGFVALAQVLDGGRDPSDYLIVPAQYYAPIRHDAVVLSRARNHSAAHAFHEFLLSTTAQTTLESFGYLPAGR
jgi:molybdate transport system substrate-binding protein